jgi:hypothetical protein
MGLGIGADPRDPSAAPHLPASTTLEGCVTHGAVFPSRGRNRGSSLRLKVELW